MELHLVADTNLFFEFKPLEQLPWDELGPDLIVIMLTKPVLDEIDKHKKASGRTRDRAIDIFGRFRAMLESGTSEAVIREASPRVVLRRATSVLPDPRLKDHLDYDKPDERLIGIVATLHASANGYDVKLFTDDGGPAGMALDLAVPFKMIDQTWRRPATESSEAKRLKEVEKDLAFYRSQEPRIEIRCDQGGKDRTVSVVRKVATPLTDGEIDEVLAELVRKHPARDDFTPPSDSVANQPNGAIKTTTYAAPSDEEISSYRTVRRAEWIESCRDVLRGLHVGRDEAESAIRLRWTLSNEGTRPALQARVEFEAKGHMRLVRVSDEPDDDEAQAGQGTTTPTFVQASRFPSPPTPPAFRETTTVSTVPAKPNLTNGIRLAELRGAPSPAQIAMVAGSLHAVDLARIGRLPDHLDVARITGASRLLQEAMIDQSRIDRLLAPHKFADVTPLPMHLPDLRPFVPRARNPEEFYYASWVQDAPVVKGALTCESWRHQSGEEVFEFDVVLGKDGDMRGVVECTVHAHNLTKPANSKVFIEQRLEAFGLLAVAWSLVDSCG